MVAGKVIRTLNNAEGIPLNDLAAGIYYLQLCDKEGRMLKVEKLVKTE